MPAAHGTKVLIPAGREQRTANANGASPTAPRVRVAFYLLTTVWSASMIDWTTSLGMATS